MKKISFLLLIFLFACASEQTNNSAIQVSIATVKANPDYFWFFDGYNSYDADKKIVQEISQIYDSTKFEFIIFTGPNCFCGIDYLKFPQSIKILDSAGIKEQNYTIFLMSDKDDQHPYKTKFTVTNIPTIVILKNNEFVYLVSDTVRNNKNSGAKPSTLEEAILAGLKK